MSTTTTPTTTPSPSLSAPFLGRPVEICIVTPSLRPTLDGLLRLGLGPFRIFHFSAASVSAQSFRGAPADFAIDVAFAEQAGMVWEVMQPVRGPSVMREFLAQTGGRGGIQHVAFDCAGGEGSSGRVRLVGEEAGRRRAEFERRGFPMIQSGVWHGKKGTCEFMFFDTAGAVNTCFETYVFSDDWEEPEDVEIYPPS